MSSAQNPGSDPGSGPQTQSGKGGPMVVIVLGVLVVGAAFLLAKNIKTSEVPQKDQQQSKTESGEPAKTEMAKSEPAKSEPAKSEPAKSEPAKTDTAKAAPTEEMEDLPLILPNPVFSGTPKDVPPGAHMLPPTGKPRPPFKAPKGVENLALGKPVTASDPQPFIGDLEMIVDDDIEALDGRIVELAPGKQWVQIDLETEAEIFAIIVWHNHTEARVYRDMIIRVSNDPDFLEYTELFNNDHDNSSGEGVGKDYEWFESFEGYLIDAKGIKARYVRSYSNGSTSDDQNHYQEIQVWGRPVK